METIFELKEVKATPEVIAEWLKTETRGVNVSLINRKVNLDILDGNLQAELRSLPRPRIRVQQTENREVWTAIIPGVINHLSNHLTFTMQAIFAEHVRVDNEWHSASHHPTLPIIIIELWPMAGGCSRVVGYCKHKEHKEYFGEYVNGIGEELSRVFGEGINTVKPTEPPKPDKSASLDHWYDYYYACKEAGIKKTFIDIAKDTSFSESHLKNNHKNYKLRRGIE